MIDTVPHGEQTEHSIEHDHRQPNDILAVKRGCVCIGADVQPRLNFVNDCVHSSKDVTASERQN